MDILICYLVMSVLQGVALPPLSVWPLPLMIDVLTLSTALSGVFSISFGKVFFLFTKEKKYSQTIFVKYYVWKSIHIN